MNDLFANSSFGEQPVILNDPPGDSCWIALFGGHPSLHAFLGLPIKRREKVLGILGIANRPNGYNTALVES
ncbi:MAG: GAF domain-containing protein, partial [Magnetococcales bacterium]|nr:GAF domain-containing protein [Magnetococcales bacterium]